MDKAQWRTIGLCCPVCRESSDLFFRTILPLSEKRRAHWWQCRRCDTEFAIKKEEPGE